MRHLNVTNTQKEIKKGPKTYSPHYYLLHYQWHLSGRCLLNFDLCVVNPRMQDIEIISHLLLLPVSSWASPQNKFWMTGSTRSCEMSHTCKENTDRAGVCRLSEATAQVIKDAALYAIPPGLVSFLQSVGVWPHSWFRAWGPGGAGGSACACVWGMLLLLSVNFIFIWTLQPQKGPRVTFY